jgi:hypothetical protein
MANNNFTTWPGLTNKLINKHLPKSIATAKGHLKHQGKNLCSTLPKPILNNDTDES